MARKRMVTRTILTTKATVLCMDTESLKSEYKDVILPRTYKDDEKLFKAVKNAVDTDTFKAVKIEEKSSVETLYGMDEQDFINSAKILDPTTRREIEGIEYDTEDEEEDEDGTEE